MRARDHLRRGPAASPRLRPARRLAAGSALLALSTSLLTACRSPTDDTNEPTVTTTSSVATVVGATTLATTAPISSTTQAPPQPPTMTSTIATTDPAPSTPIACPPSPTTTTTVPAPPPTAVGAQPALDVLASIIVENEHPENYDRELFGYPASTGNGCDTRDEVLIRDSLTPAQVDPSGCQVLAGDWLSVYDNLTWSDPAELQIDHV